MSNTKFRLLATIAIWSALIMLYYFLGGFQGQVLVGRPGLFVTTWVPFLLEVSDIAIVVALIMFPLALFQKLRRSIYMGMSTVFGVLLISILVWSISLTFQFLGIGGVVVGLLFAGCGVIPVALLASVWNGEWLTAGVMLGVLISGFGFLALGQLVNNDAA